MRVVIQRVSEANLTIDRKIYSAISEGLVLLIGIEDDDNHEDIEWLSGKITRLRIFNDDNNVMNNSVVDIGGDIMVISQFTLHASTRKGNRPSYIKASKPDVAVPLYEKFIEQITADLGKPVSTGIFGADMQINLTNNGPVTIIIDSKKRE